MSSAVFNLLEALLIGLTERETLDKLTLIGVNTSGDIGSRLEYGYWVTIASLIIFVFLTILCGVLACNMQVSPRPTGRGGGGGCLCGSV